MSMIGFTIGGMMMISVVLIIVFSTLDTFALSSSEKSVIKNVNSALNLDNPKMCENFDDTENCIVRFAHLKKDPSICISYIDDKEKQYGCISNFFRKYKEQSCTFLEGQYYDRCIKEIQHAYKE